MRLARPVGGDDSTRAVAATNDSRCSALPGTAALLMLATLMAGVGLAAGSGAYVEYPAGATRASASIGRPASYCSVGHSTPQATPKCPAVTLDAIIRVVFGSHDTITAVSRCSAFCHRLQHADAADGSRDTHLQLLALEMESWIRANQTVGIFPDIYVASVQRDLKLVRLLARLWGQQLRLSGSSSQSLQAPRSPYSTDPPRGEEEEAEAAANAMSGHVDEVGVVETDAESYNQVPGLLAEIFNVSGGTTEASHLRLSAAVLQSYVPEETLKMAIEYYTSYVQRRLIVRSYHVAPELRELHAVSDFVRSVVLLWQAAKQRALRDPRPPLLPSVRPSTGPTVTFTQDSIAAALGHNSPSAVKENSAAGHNHSDAVLAAVARALTRLSKMVLKPESLTRHTPSIRVLPTVVELYYDMECAACAPVSAAFDLLPFVYRRLCEAGHSSIISCSPVTLFFKIPESRPFRVVPALSVYSGTGEGVRHSLTKPLGGKVSTVSFLVDWIMMMVSRRVVQMRLLSPDEVEELEARQRRKRARQMEKQKRERLAIQHEDNSTEAAGGSQSTEVAQAPDGGGTAATEVPGSNHTGHEVVDEEDDEVESHRVVAVSMHVEELIVAHLSELTGSRGKKNLDSPLNSLEPGRVQLTFLQGVSLLMSLLWVATVIWYYTASSGARANG